MYCDYIQQAGFFLPLVHIGSKNLAPKPIKRHGSSSSRWWKWKIGARFLLSIELKDDILLALVEDFYSQCVPKVRMYTSGVKIFNQSP